MASQKSPKSSPSKSKSTHPVRIGISEAHLKEISKLLVGVLADQHVLYLKTRNFHWNLVGDRFKTLHAFYQTQYEALALDIDETAERIRMLGGVAPGSMKEFLGLASLSEEKGREIYGEESIEILMRDHEACTRSLRKAVDRCDSELGDTGTADFLTDLMKRHEKAAWMLRSFLG